MTPEEFFAILYAVPDIKPQTHRLYHDDQGQVLFYTMEDLPGSYIVVDASTYAQARYDVKVVSGQLQELPKSPSVIKLVPSDQGTCCHPRDVCLLVPENHEHIKWSVKQS